MKVFKDANGKDWLVAVNVAQVKLVRARLRNAEGKPLDLYRLVEGDMAGLAELLGDPVLLVDTLYVLCSRQAEKDRVTDEQFGEAMAGDALEAAADAFLGALIDFFPSEKTRKSLRTVNQKQKELTGLMDQERTRRLEGLDLQAELAKLMPPAPGDSRRQNGSSTSAQGPAESTPAPSPSES